MVTRDPLADTSTESRALLVASLDRTCQPRSWDRLGLAVLVVMSLLWSASLFMQVSKLKDRQAEFDRTLHGIDYAIYVHDLMRPDPADMIRPPPLEAYPPDKRKP